MSQPLAERVDAIRRHYDDGCFACGRDNPIGLHLDDFRMEDDVVAARFTPRDDYRGTPKTLHGGVAATAIDEILVWAGILIEEVMSVTGTMELKFHKPVPVGESLVVSARIDQKSGRRLQVSGELTLDDETHVSGSGLYLVTAEIEDLLRGAPTH